MNRKIQIALVVIIVISLSITTQFVIIKLNEKNNAATSWYNSDWKYSKQITIDHTKVAGNLTNFPVLISTSGAEYAFAQTNGNDFIFMDSTNATKYNHEIESFNGTNLIAWVNITSLSSSVDTIIYMYYGNPICSNQQNVEGTWDSDFIMIQHFEESGATVRYDSTSNNYDGTPTNYDGDEKVTGKIGLGDSLYGRWNDATTDYITIPYQSSMNVQNYTVSSWVKTGYMVPAEGTNNIIQRGVWDYGTYYFGFHPGYTPKRPVSNLNMSGTIYGRIVDASPGVIDYVWSYVTWTRDGSQLKTYLNETMKDNYTQAGTLSTTVDSLTISAPGNSLNRPYNGTLDEMRISKIARSLAWIQTEYNTTNSPSTFESFGLQQRYDPTTWYSSSWKYNKKITIDHTKVNATLTNFPVLISNISTDFSWAQASGNDFVFLNETNQTKYNHEIESFDRTSGTLVAWVNITLLSSTIDTIIYMYYGNSASSNQQNVPGTWDSNYVAVWHMNDSSSLSITDSKNNYTGTKIATNEPIATSAKIGYGQLYDNTNDEIGLGTERLPRGAKTIEVWFKTMSGTHMIYDNNGKGGSDKYGTSMYLQNGAVYVLIGKGTPGSPLLSFWTTGLYGNGNWQHVAFTWDGTTDSNKGNIYMNGASVATGTASTTETSVPSYTDRIGNSGLDKYPFNGTLDEVRLSNMARTSTWLSTEYNNQNSTSTFETFGSQQGSPYGVSWYDPSWSYCKKITIDHTKVAANLTNFPVLFSNISADLKHAQSTGNDFVFVDAINTTKYNHEIESFNSTTGELVAWINITSLSSVNDTIIYLYYGNPTCSNQQNKIGTWDSNYITVQHMNGASYSNIVDSTSGNHNATAAGGTPNYDSAGKVGKAVNFDGVNEYVDLDASNLFTPSTGLTLESWASDANGDYSDDGLLGKLHTGDSSWRFSFGISGHLTYYNILIYGTGGGYIRRYATTGNPSDTNFHYFSGTWDGSTSGDGIKLYVDKIRKDDTTENSGTFTAIKTSAAKVSIGDEMDSGSYTTWDGVIDEVRISNIERSTAWMNTTCTTINSTSTFMTLGNEQTNWYNTTFLYRKKITIDHNKVDADLTNFPVLISTTMNTTKVQSNGNDIFFTSSSGTKLNHEIESYNSTSGVLVSWVNVTSVSSTTPDTYIYLYYGNTTCSSQQNVAGTWDSNYIGVWHMNTVPTSTGSNIIDSTYKGHNSTTSGNFWAGARVNSKIGYGLNFNGTTNYVDIADADDLTLASGFTIEYWAYPTKTSISEPICKGSYSGGQWQSGTEYLSEINSYQGIHLFDTTGSNYIYRRSSASVLNNWIYDAYTYDGGTLYTGLHAYPNSTEVSYVGGGSGGTFNSMKNGAFNLHFGYGDAAQWMQGTLDEIRISKIVRSTTWLSTEYKNQNDPANVTIYSSEEQYSGAGGTNAAPGTPTGLGPTTRQVAPTVTIYATATDPNGDAITMYFYNNATQAEIGHQSGSSGSNISITWSGLSQGTSYSFYAAAFDSQAWSSNSTVCTFTTNAPPYITGLMTENLTDPNRITSFIPYFNWTYTDNNSDTQQSYQIQVGTTQNGSNLWDSGNVTSAATNVKYNGTALSRSTLYYVRIRAYDGYEWSTW